MYNSEFPKIIWFLWLQGLDSAPLVVRKCRESWVRHNPGWKLVFLDENNITEYTDIKPGKITTQAFSDVLRINLLAAQGGLWVDATCYCNKPLDDWLYDCLATGFFAFNRPAPDRMLSSWFLAANPGNYITTAYKQAVNNYWERHPNLTFFEESSWYFLNKRFARGKTSAWFGSLVTSVLKVYPYFWFHYLFEFTYQQDKKFGELWDQTPKISADIPHKLQFAGLLNPITREISEEIDHQISPVYKLTWKYDDATFKQGCILDYLLNGAR